MSSRIISCIMLFLILFGISLITIRENSIKLHLKKCIETATTLYVNETNVFFQHFSSCIKSNIPGDETKMDIFANGIYGERKAFLPLKSDSQKSECIWLTIGIGGDAEAEFLFKEKYPHCKIFGVEPGSTGNFSLIGTVIPFGVGLKNAVEDAVMYIENKWQPKKLNVLSLPYIMDTYVHSRLIYYLTIDIEGIEYKILEALVGNGKFANEDLTFCQIDAELHNVKMETIHPDIKNLNPVSFIAHFLQNSSPYIPIFNEPYTFHPHQKITFINIVDPRCEHAFMFSALFKH